MRACCFTPGCEDRKPLEIGLGGNALDLREKKSKVAANDNHFDFKLRALTLEVLRLTKLNRKYKKSGAYNVMEVSKCNKMYVEN